MFLSGGMIALAIVGVVVLLLIIVLGWFISTRNSFVRMLVDIDNSSSRIDVYLTKRYDVLTKMLDTTKGYAKHEQETLANVISMRQPSSNASMKEKSEFLH